MEKNKLMELAEKMGFNKKAVEAGFKADAKAQEKQILDANKFMKKGK